MCLTRLKAEIVEKNGRVYMEKFCHAHGSFSLLISCHPEYYRELNRFYFSLMQRSLPQRDYIVHLTNKCNLACPICLADADRCNRLDYPLSQLKDFLRGKRNYKIDLMGAEPTMREDLAEIIRAVKHSGNIAALHTNGIKISDFNYLQQLKEAGLDEAHLQFDGFDDCIYEKIRGGKLLEIKLKALYNLEKLDIATDLVATIVRGVNEKEMTKILKFGVEHKFIKEIFFLGCRFLGKAKDLPIENCMMPDELIDVIERDTDKRISRRDILGFQKLYFALLAACSIRKCFYIHHYLVTRSRDGYIPLGHILDIGAIQSNLEKFKEMKLAGNILALPYLALFLISKLIGFKGLLLVKEFLSFGFLFLRGFNLSRLPKKSLLLGFISACDAYSLDYQIARNCGKGAISLEFGIRDIGAIDNVIRDRVV